MAKPIIDVQNISKRYKLGQIQGYKTIRESFSQLWSRRDRRPPQSDSSSEHPDYIWALQDVSFEVQMGELVGIIGRNGAGKSTLLKILTRITEPTKGSAFLRGRVSSLLEVGTGFHPELTGRENVYLNGAILGMHKNEIAKKFDEIIAFAEVEKFVDTPVKRYSSGMYVRLAFAVAAHLEPEILLVDEVLAVGDASFQKKCLGKMGDVVRGGRTILFVSHNMGAINRLCTKTVWIDQGRIVEFGATGSVINRYLSSSGETENTKEFRADAINSGQKIGKARLLRVSIKNAQNETANTINTDSPLALEIEYELRTRLDNVRMGYRLIANDGTVIFTSHDTDPEGWGNTRDPGIYVSRCLLPANLLNAGRYYITVSGDLPMQEWLFTIENAVSFDVQLTTGVGGTVPDNRQGIMRPLLKWDIFKIAQER